MTHTSVQLGLGNPSYCNMSHCFYSNVTTKRSRTAVEKIIYKWDWDITCLLCHFLALPYDILRKIPIVSSMHWLSFVKLMLKAHFKKYLSFHISIVTRLFKCLWNFYSLLWPGQEHFLFLLFFKFILPAFFKGGGGIHIHLLVTELSYLWLQT